MIKKLIGGAVVLVVVAGAALWWFVLRDDAPEELGVGTGSRSEEPTGTAPASFDGEWTSTAGGDTRAGFRIEEDFAGGVVGHTAVGRSSEVTGSITIAGTQVTEGSFTVDMTALEFTDDPPSGNVTSRAGAMETQGLETAEFPEGTFTLTAPIDLGAIPAEGETVTVEATGDLTLHGVTREITFSIDALVAGASIEVATTDPVPIVLADYEIEEPSAPFVASVADEGSFEFLLVLRPA
jgi:polyisoprenoid-binding protein YceI